VVWTTTPWTIPVNQGIAYNPDVKYLLVHATALDGSKQRYLIAEDLTAEFLIRTKLMERATAGELERVDVSSPEFKGSDLIGTVVRHPMHKLGGFFAKPRPFLPGDFVTTDQGTGLVHMAPDHGEDDFELCRANGIDPVFAVDAGGFYRPDWLWLGGQGSVINAKFNAPDGPICSDLAEAGALLAGSSDFQHSYPHSWRSKAKVIYRCTPQWFIAMDQPLPHLSPLTRAEQRWENEGGDASEAMDDRNPTLRQLAIDAIAATRFVPEKGRNRLGSMVEQRPDWVISRQRAWGVPIALFVERSTGELLVDHEVNQRIIEAVRKQGVDGWDSENAGYFLGNRNPEDYEMVTDILDVWFDSGCTHVFTLESGHWPEERWPADLYLEGSDQHRGWFQSSLLESCGTRGRAPYNAVLTHGFTMDSKGMKMSKSLGNTVSPLDLMKEYGADILRLWALSVDFTEDHRIGKEILAGVADQYRKLRNTFRYMLGSLDGFSDEERLDDVSAYPDLDRYMLHLTAELDQKLRNAVDDFDYNTYTRLLSDFANNDLSAFYFDIRRDSLYCDSHSSTKRRAYRTVLDTLFHALVRWLSPVLVFTTEEVWGTRYPEERSVHLLEWPVIPPVDADVERWNALRELRAEVTARIEPLRRDKVLGASLEAEVWVPSDEDPELLEELFITSTVRKGDWKVVKTQNRKCARCWRHRSDVNADSELDTRCDEVVNG
jgi:isoleucyl-tRNA synthetase